MISSSPHKHKSRGFSLIIVAMIVSIAGALMILNLPITADRKAKEMGVSTDKINKIVAALETYRISNGGVLPLPAGLSYYPNHASFGLAVSKCADGFVYCNEELATRKYRVGAVPTRTLGLPDNYAFDQWNNRYTYAMYDDDRLLPSRVTIPVKDVNEGGIPGVKGIVISHGPNGLGAFNYAGEVSACTNALLNASYSELENCDYRNSDTDADVDFISSQPISSPDADKFSDDIVRTIHSCPSNILGCNLWLDSTDNYSINNNVTPANDDAVTLWKDKSGKGSHAVQTNTNLSPRYVSATSKLYFDGSRSMTLPNFMKGAQAGSIIYVAERTGAMPPAAAASAGPVIGDFSEGDPDEGSYYPFTDSQVKSDWGKTNQTDFNDDDESIGYLHLGSATVSANDWTYYLDGRSSATDVEAEVDFNGYGTGPKIGEQTKDGSSKFIGNIIEIAAYPRKLSEDERKKIECEMADRWYIYIGHCTLCPGEVAGCKLWLDGGDEDSMTHDVANVISEWKDKSGNNYHATQATANARPVLENNTVPGAPDKVVYFNSDYLDVSDKFNYLHQLKGGSIFIVTKSDPIGGGTTNAFLGTSGGTDSNVGFVLFRAYASKGPHIRMTNGDSAHNVIYYDSSTDHIGSTDYILTNVILNPGAVPVDNRSVMRIDGGASLTGNTRIAAPTTAQAANNLSIGSSGGGAQRYSGQIAEVLIYDRQLNPRDQKRVECYLAKRWKLPGYDLSTPDSNSLNCD